MATKRETTVSELFDNRICQKFAKTPCSDGDLLAVSRMLAGTPTAAVGTCLGLEEHEMDAISESSKRHSKVHLMLQQWRFRSKENATWISLVECLRTLSDSTLNMKTIQIYLIQKDSPPSGFSVTHPYTYGQEHHLKSSPWILSPLDGGVPIDPTARRNTRKMEEIFAGIVALTQETLSDVPLEQIHDYLTKLSVNREEHVPLLSKEMVKIIKTLSLNQIFVQFNQIGMWDFLNFDLLVNLAKEYGDDGLRAQIKTYTAQIKSLQNGTSIYDFSHVWSGRVRCGSLRDRKPLMVKLTGTFLADITHVRRTIAQEFLLNPYVLILGNIECRVPPATEIEATWLIPTPAVPVMMARKTFRASSNILELSVDGKPISISKAAAYQRMLAERNFGIIKGKFASILNNVCSELQKNLSEERIKDLRLFAISFFEPATAPLPDTTELLQIFEAMTRNKLWDYRNYYPLQVIVEKFGGSVSTQMKGWLEAYVKDLSGFQVATKIKYYIAITQPKRPRSMSQSDELLSPEQRDPQFISKLSWKLEEEVADYTLDYLEYLWKSLIVCSSLPPLHTVLDCIEEGCVSVIWRIHSTLALQLIEKAGVLVNFFQKHPFLMVCVNGKCIYKRKQIECNIGNPDISSHG